MKLQSAIQEFSGCYGPRRLKLVAVSGGRDSVAMLHALHSAGHRRLVVCHLNHRLRGRESAGDAAFVRRLAAKLGLPVEVSSADVKLTAARSGISLETAGREARHRFLAECSRRYRCRIVLLAHHAGDQAETVLFNLFRGSAGLRGMAPETEIAVPGFRRPLVFLRPLLKVPRAEIDAWIAHHRLSFREDASNAGTAPVRNIVRHQLLPAICRAMGRDVRPALCRATEIAAADAALLDSMAAPYAAHGELDVAALTTLPDALQRRVVRLWLAHLGFPDIGFPEVESVRGLLDTQNGPAGANLPGNRFVRRRAGKLREHEL